MMQTGPSFQAKRPDFVFINTKNRFGHWIDSTVSADYRMKVKEGENLDKY